MTVEYNRHRNIFKQICPNFDKSEKAFQVLKFEGYEVVDRAVYYTKRKQRDEEARRAYMLELENDIENGIFIRDLMKEGGQ